MSTNQTINIQTTSINAITPTDGSLSVGESQTTGVLNLGTGVRTAAGVVNIATGASNACAMNILNGATTAGSVNIANGTGATQTTEVNIGTGSTTGTVTIGGASNTVQVNGSLTMGSTRNITLKTDGVAPTQDTQLGGTRTGTLSVTNPPVLATVLATMTLTVAGIYLFNFNLQIPTSSKGTTNSVGMTGANVNTVRYGATNADTTFTGFNGSQVVRATATVYTLVFISTNSTFNGLVTGYFTATRIA